MTARPPEMTITDQGYRCSYGDGSALEAVKVRKVRGQWCATVTALHGDEVLHRADIRLLRQADQWGFHRAASHLNGHIHWAARLQALITGILQAEEGGEAPPPTAPPPVPAPPFPIAALPEPLRRLAEAGAAALPCPIDYIAVPMLAAAGVAIGNAYAIEVKRGWREGPRIFCGVIGPSGAKKSPALHLAMQPLYEYQIRLSRAFEAKEADYARAVAAYDLAMADWRDRVRRHTATADEKPPEPVRPVMRQIWTADATIEAVADLLQQNRRGLILIQDELTAWVLAMNQYKRGKGADRQHWLSIWNGAPLMVNRKGQRGVSIAAPFVCVSGCMPPDVLDDLVDERGRQDGFLPRLLLAFPDPIPLRYSAATVDDEVVRQYREVVFALLAMGRDDSPTVVTMTPAAHADFAALLDEVYGIMESADCPPGLREPLAKMQGYAARFALIIQLTRKAAGATDRDSVDRESVAGAAQLVRYFAAHMRRVYAQLQVTPEDRRIDQAIRWITSHGNAVTARALQRHRVAGIKDASQARAFLSRLQERGYGVVKEGPKGQVMFTLSTVDT